MESQSKPIVQRVGDLSPEVRISVPEAARILGWSESTAWRRIRSGELPVHRSGRITRVKVADLRAL